MNSIVEGQEEHASQLAFFELKLAEETENIKLDSKVAS